MKHNGGTDLSHELKQLAQEAEALAGISGENLSEKAKDIRDRLAAALEVVQETIADMEEHASASLKEVDKTIRDKPYQALAVALGVGVAVGLLLKRK